MAASGSPVLKYMHEIRWTPELSRIPGDTLTVFLLWRTNKMSPQASFRVDAIGRFGLYLFDE